MSRTPRSSGQGHDGEMLCTPDIVTETLAEEGYPPLSSKVAALFAKGLDNHLEHILRSATVVFAAFANRLDSDLERKLFAALVFLRDGFGDSPSVFGGELGNPPMGSGFRVAPQEPVAQYTVDFAIYANGPASGKHLKFAVECDGQYFHDRTPEQVARDKRRDRAIAEYGYLVIRFTEAEINADPFACAAQVERIVTAAQQADISQWSGDGFRNGGEYA